MSLQIITQMLSRFLFLFLKVNSGNRFPQPLSPAEEHDYFIKCRNGDTEARNQLIVHNLRLVAHIVKKYLGSGVSSDDLMSIGTIGLIKAIDSFDVENGARFATYASKCLQNEILMFFRSHKKTMGEISINETIDIDKDGNPLTYIDIISCEDTIADDLDMKIKIGSICRIIDSRLNERERKIIILRYGLDGSKPITQREIAEKLKISRSYVSRIEKSALDKLRKELDGK